MKGPQRRRSAHRASVRPEPAQLNAQGRQFLQRCLGADADPEDAFSDASDDSFQSARGSPAHSNGGDAWARRIRFLLSRDDSDDEDFSRQRAANAAAGPSLEAVFGFEAAAMARLGQGAASSRDANGGCLNVLNYIFIDDDDDDEEEDGCADGLEEIFSFDLEKVAEALRLGASPDELSSVIEEAMIQDLPERLCSLKSEAPASACSTATPRTGDISGLMTPPSLLSTDLEGLRTPPRATGWTSPAPRAPPSGTLAADLVQRLEQGPRRTARRRSSIAEHPKLLQAVGSAAKRHRRSLQQAVVTEIREEAQAALPRSVAAKVRRSVATSSRRHRNGLIRAAEVLEAAGVGVGASNDAAATPEVMDQLVAVERAMRRARRRHRESIVVAVTHITQTINEEASPRESSREAPREGLAASAAATGAGEVPEEENYFQQRVNEIVAAAFSAFASMSCFARPDKGPGARGGG